MILGAIPILENGMEKAWGGVLVTLFGSPLIGITGLSYGFKRNLTNEYGAGDTPIGRGQGNVEFDEGKLTVRQREIEKIVKASPLNDLTLIPFFDIVIKISDLKTAKGTIVTLHNCQFKDQMFTSKQGDTKIESDLTFIFAGITQQIL